MKIMVAVIILLVLGACLGALWTRWKLSRRVTRYPLYRSKDETEADEPEFVVLEVPDSLVEKENQK